MFDVAKVHVITFPASDGKFVHCICQSAEETVRLIGELAGLDGQEYTHTILSASWACQADHRCATFTKSPRLS
jgi:hypothetical protein